MVQISAEAFAKTYIHTITQLKKVKKQLYG